MSFYFIFWDGVGYGKKNPSVNPFFSASLPTLRKLFHNSLPSLHHKYFTDTTASFSPVNATLRVAGLPQSGTGQATIMTGINASQYIGKHFGPYPYSTLVPIIKEQNLFQQLKERNRTFYFVNGFPKKYLDFLNDHRKRIPTIALSYISTGKTLSSHHEIQNGEAISADITGSRWEELGHAEVTAVSPLEAGKKFYRLGKNYDLIFFEYFVPDYAGHKQDMKLSVEALERMDGFLGGILEHFDDKQDILLMISDHGNIEDLSVRTHTRNPVPLIMIGKDREYFSSRIKNLTHITPAILSYFDRTNEQ